VRGGQANILEANCLTRLSKSTALLAVLAYLSFILLNEIGSIFWYFEVRVRFLRKEFTLAISSPDEFLYCHFLVML